MRPRDHLTGGVICAALGLTLLADAQSWVGDTLVWSAVAPLSAHHRNLISLLTVCTAAALRESIVRPVSPG
ncbi:MAG: hypothetical protein WCP98_10275 [Actinomycetes bacterium]